MDRMHQAVMVPIHADVLVLRHDTPVLEPMADFSRLPYATAAGDANADIARTAACWQVRDFGGWHEERITRVTRVEVSIAGPTSDIYQDSWQDSTVKRDIDNVSAVCRRQAAGLSGESPARIIERQKQVAEEVDADDSVDPRPVHFVGTCRNLRKGQVAEFEAFGPI